MNTKPLEIQDGAQNPVRLDLRNLFPFFRTLVMLALVSVVHGEDSGRYVLAQKPEFLPDSSACIIVQREILQNGQYVRDGKGQCCGLFTFYPDHTVVRLGDYVADDYSNQVINGAIFTFLLNGSENIKAIRSGLLKAQEWVKVAVNNRVTNFQKVAGTYMWAGNPMKMTFSCFPTPGIGNQMGCELEVSNQNGQVVENINPFTIDKYIYMLDSID